MQLAGKRQRAGNFRMYPYKMRIESETVGPQGCGVRYFRMYPYKMRIERIREKHPELPCSIFQNVSL